jgi:hypothetical protein
MKVLSIILKIIETIMVCIWAVAVGIFFPVCILAFGMNVLPAGAEDIANNTGLMVTWLCTSVIGYLLPAALIFMKHYRVAAGMSAAGLIGVLVVHSTFSDMYLKLPGNDGSYVGPTGLYLPLIFVTLLVFAILAIEERRNIAKLFEEKKKKKDEKAPSILGDD